MPLYDYNCTAPACKHRFESLQKMAADVIVCEKCGAEAQRDEIPQIRHLANDVNANACSLRIHFNWVG